MKHVKTLHLYRYWAALKGRRAMPALAAFQPSILRSLMADMFTLRGPAAEIGYAGSRFRELFGEAPDGVAFSALWREQDGVVAGRFRDAVLTEKLPTVAQLSLVWARRPPLEAEMLLVPAEDAGGATAAMAAIAMFSPPYEGEGHPALAIEALAFPTQIAADDPSGAAAPPEPAMAAFAARSWPLRLIGNG